MAGEVAVNDAGDVMILGADNQWQRATVAQNDRGDRMYLNGNQWAPVPQSSPPSTQGWLPTAIARGVGDLVGMAGDIRDLRRTALRAISPEAAAIQEAKPNRLANMLPNGNDVSGFIMRNTGITPTEAQTPLGRIAADGVRMATGSAVGGGLPSMLRNMALGGTAGLLSGGAGELTAGTAAEPAARIAGALAPSGAAALRAAVRGQPIQEAVRALEGVTPQQMDQAQELMRQSSRLGSPITLPEAVQQVVGGRITGLQGAQDLAQNSIGGQRVMGPFLDQRNAGAVRAVNSIDVPGPTSAMPPEVTGQRIMEEAGREVSAVRGARSSAVAPMYQAASDAVTNSPQVAQRVEQALNRSLTSLDNMAAGNPALEGVVTRLRDRLAAGQNNWEALQDVRREIRDLMRPMREGERPVLDRKTGALVGREIQGLTNNLHMIVPQLRAADAEYIRLSRSLVDPVEQGMLGRLAETDNPMMQRGILFPQSQTGGQIINAPGSTQATVERLSGANPTRGRVDVDAMQSSRNLLRAELDARIEQALATRAQGPTERPGAAVVSRLAPTEQRVDTLEQAFRALPNGDEAARGFRILMDTLGAQAYQPAANSATARRLAQQQGATRAVVAPVQWAQDWLKNADTRALAEAITTPEGFHRLRALAAIDDPGRREAAIRGILALNRARVGAEQP